MLRCVEGDGGLVFAKGLEDELEVVFECGLGESEGKYILGGDLAEEGRLDYHNNIKCI